SGFTPLNHASDVLDIQRRPERVILLPTVVIALLVCALAIVTPRSPRRRVPLFAWLCSLLLVVGAVASLLATDALRTSVLLLIVALLAPIGLAWGLIRANLPLQLAAGTFLVTTTALFLRADFVFLREHGFPTPDGLFAAKFSNAPYDFHYYALQN